VRFVDGVVVPTDGIGMLIDGVVAPTDGIGMLIDGIVVVGRLADCGKAVWVGGLWRAVSLVISVKNIIRVIVHL
jgi:hypothetical protein